MRPHPRQDLHRSLGAALGGWLLLLSLVAAASLLIAAAPAEIVVSSHVDKVRLTEEEPLTFSVTIAGPIHTAPRVSLSSLEGFQVLSTGQSQQVQIRGGETQLAVTLQYVLAPTVPGKHTLGPVTVEHEGRRYQTAPIEVEVLPATHEPTPPKLTPRRLPVRGGTVL